ncbi:MAG: CHRD domain-containing protein [Phycisphaerales bacterium]|nr:MAG: CHRD domain-containing protein [Phycisphaerales bacterium]
MTSKSYLVITIIVYSVFGWCAGALGATAEFTISLDGAQAAAGAGTGSAATGTGTVTLDTGSNSLAWNIAFEDGKLTNGAGSVTAAHFHAGPAGVDGVVISPPGNVAGAGTSPISGSVTISEADKKKLLAGAVYFNIHTTAFAGGEIRGQLVPAKIVIRATKDNTLFQSATGTLSNGSGQHLFCGRSNNGDIKRGLIMFDVAGSGIPAGATITAARLELSMSKTIVGSQNVELRRVLKDWGEGSSNASGSEGGGAPAAAGDSTWLHTFFNSAFWQNAGGDFSGTASAARAVAGTGRYSWESAQMTSDVQLWLDEPAVNFGWLIRGNESFAPTAKRFDSRESPTNQPALTVEYTGPCLFELAGDVNNDCTVDFHDLAFLATNWLVDCERLPVDPACLARY